MKIRKMRNRRTDHCAAALKVKLNLKVLENNLS